MIVRICCGLDEGAETWLKPSEEGRSKRPSSVVATVEPAVNNRPTTRFARNRLKAVVLTGHMGNT